MHASSYTGRISVPRHIWAVLGVVLLLCAIIAGIYTDARTANAATNQTINFQARLMSNTGAIAPDGDYNIEFKLYTAAAIDGGETLVQGSCTTAGPVADEDCVWTETRTGAAKVRVANGYLTVNLGSETAFASTIEWDQDLWLGMNVGGIGTPSWDGEMSPRLKLTAVPYAFKAAQLSRLAGGNTGTLKLADSFGQDTVITLPDPVAGTATVCYQNSASCGFLSGATTDYIQNGTTVQTAANFNIRSSAIGSVTGVLQGANGQTADLFNVQTWNGSTATTVFGVDSDGDLAVQSVNVAANKNIVLSAGTGTYTQTYSNTTGVAATFAVTDTASSGTTSVQGVAINLTGTNNAGGTNSVSGLVFGNVAAATNNAFHGIDFGTGFNDLLRYNGTALISGTGIVQSAAINGSYTNLTGVGTLTAGSLGVGFTTVDVARGGTGATTLTANGVLFGSGTNAIQATDVGDDGECLLGDTGNAPYWGSCVTSTATLQTAYAAGNTISTTGNDIAFTLNGTDDFTITTTAGDAASTILTLTDGSNAAPPAQLLLVQNNDTNESLASGIKVVSAAGGIAAALDVSDAEITNAISVGDNVILGGAATINFTNFDVSSAGALTAVGVDAGSGLLQGGNGLTVNGTVSINSSANNNVSINTGTSTGQINLGGGNAILTIDSSTVDINAGAVSGVTTLSTSGIITQGALGSATNASYLCYNGSSQIAACSATATGAAFVQGGNSFETTATLGTNDDNDLVIERFNTAKLTVGANGVTLANGFDLTLQAAGAYISNKQGYTNSESFGDAANVGADGTLALGAGTGAGYAGSIALGAGAQTTATNQLVIGGSSHYINNVVVGNGVSSASPQSFTLQGTSAATGQSNVAGASVTIAGGQSTGNAFGGSINFQVSIPGSTGSTQNSLATVVSFGGAAGAALFQNADDSTQGFNVKRENGDNIFTVDTSNSRVGINLGGSTTPTLSGAGLELNGALRISGTVTDTFTTPNVLGSPSNVPTKINIPAYNPGAFGQILAFGLTDASPTSARALSLFDARSSAHQPTISVFSPDEADVFGLSWDGSVTNAYLKSTDSTIIINTSAGDVATFASTISLAKNTTVTGTNTFLVNGGLTTLQAGLTANGGAVQLNASSNNNTSINTGSSTGAVDIGNSSAGAITLQSGSTITIGTTSGTGTITLGQSTASNTINIGNATTATGNTQTVNIATSGTGTGKAAVTIGNTNDASSLTLQAGTGNIVLNTAGTVRATFNNTNTLYLGNGVSAGTPNGFTIQGTGSTTTAVAGGALTIQGGTATTGDANGGRVTIAGGTGAGTGVKGLVVLDTVTYATATTQTSGSNANITQSNIDSFGAVVLDATAADVAFTLSDPTLGVNAAGRIIYVVAANGTDDFTLRANVGEGVGVEQNISMRQNTTATMVWTGTNWTAAGASSSTTLQAAYDNTLSSAGGAEIVLNNSATSNGFTLRNNPDDPIIGGGLLEVQTSIGTNLFSVNNNISELAANGGGENDSTFTTNWTALGTSSISRTTTSGQYATGAAGVNVVSGTTAGNGVRNNLASNPATNTTYMISFTAMLASATFTDLRVDYTPTGATTGTQCIASQTIVTSSWTRITCEVTTPATAVTNPDVLIYQVGAAGASRTFYVDNLSMTLADDAGGIPNNVQIGGGIYGGSPTLFTLDRSSAPPVANGNTTYYGSMYYDTTTGRIQCYESDGWGACGSAPNNIITLTPEYTGAVLAGPGNGVNPGVGTMTADFCSNEPSILEVNTTFCADGISRNYYKWTSPQPTQQSYSIYVSYKLPTTFKEFEDANTIKLTALSDDVTNGTVDFQVFRTTGAEVASCGSPTTVTTPSSDTWYQVSFGGDETACNFTGGDSIIFKINVRASNNASVYVENLDFTYLNT